VKTKKIGERAAISDLKFELLVADIIKLL